MRFGGLPRAPTARQRSRYELSMGPLYQPTSPEANVVTDADEAEWLVRFAVKLQRLLSMSAAQSVDIAVAEYKTRRHADPVEAAKAYAREAQRGKS